MLQFTTKKLRFNELDRLPAKSGIYYAIDGRNKIRYVGKAKNLRDRWSRHEKCDRLARLGCCTLRYRIVKEHWLLFEEACDIKQYDPDVNTQHPDPEDHWNWRMRFDCWLGNIGVVAGSFAIALLILHLTGSPIPAKLVQVVLQNQVERSAK